MPKKIKRKRYVDGYPTMFFDVLLLVELPNERFWPRNNVKPDTQICEYFVEERKFVTVVALEGPETNAMNKYLEHTDAVCAACNDWPDNLREASFGDMRLSPLAKEAFSGKENNTQ